MGHNKCIVMLIGMVLQVKIPLKYINKRIYVGVCVSGRKIECKKCRSTWRMHGRVACKNQLMLPVVSSHQYSTIIAHNNMNVCK